MQPAIRFRHSFHEKQFVSYENTFVSEAQERTVQFTIRSPRRVPILLFAQGELNGGLWSKRRQTTRGPGFRNSDSEATMRD